VTITSLKQLKKEISPAYNLLLRLILFLFVLFNSIFVSFVSINIISDDSIMELLVKNNHQFHQKIIEYIHIEMVPTEYIES
jgi:hypothetical protein